MIRYVGYSIGASVWFALVFLISWRVTFPSDEASQYVAYRLSEATRGAYKVQMASIAPWGVGVKATDLEVYAAGKDAAGEGDTLLISFDRFRAHSSVGTLLAQTPRIKGDAELSGAPIQFDVETLLEDGLFQLQSVTFDSNDVPFSVLTNLLGESMGMVMSTTGGLNSEVKLDLSKGLKEADGSIELSSNDLVITSLEVPMMGPLGQQIVVDDLDIKLDIDDGKAKVDQGVIDSDAVSIDLEGEISLRDPVDRSSLRLDAVLELGEAFSMVETFLRSAKWDDDKYHYTISGTIGRPSFRPARQPSSRSATASSTRTRPSAAGVEAGFDPRSLAPEDGAPSTKDAGVDGELDERRARRDEIRRRLSLGRGTMKAIRPEFEADEEFEGEEEFDEEFEGDEDEEDDLEQDEPME
jgi:type II secretion system protein N